MTGRTNVERGRDVRALLLKVAAELIGEVGWTGVSTRLLADRAGVRPGLVHYHFRSVQALLRQATLETMEAMLDESAGLVSGATNPAEGVEALLTELDRYDGTDPASLLFIEGYLAATRDPELHRELSALVARFRTALTASLAEAGHPTPDAVARLVMAVLDGFVLHKGLDPELSAARIAPALRAVVRVESRRVESRRVESRGAEPPAPEPPSARQAEPSQPTELPQANGAMS